MSNVITPTNVKQYGKQYGAISDVHSSYPCVLQDYDNTKVIFSSVKNLNALKKLLCDRSKANYGRDKKRLYNDVVLYGSFSSDTCGNTWKIICQLSEVVLQENDNQKKIVKRDFYPLKEIPDIPTVLNHTEFKKHLDEYLKSLKEKNRNYSIDYHMKAVREDSLPSDHVLCKVCKQGWNIKNLWDLVERYENKKFDLTTQEGKTVGELNRIFGKKVDGSYSVSVLTQDKDRYVYNPNYIIQKGDVGKLGVVRYLHKDCHKKDTAASELEYYSKMFKDAGFDNFNLEEITNEYCLKECCAPWFIVKTAVGDIKIGWRKRVINIDWSSTKRDLTKLFDSEKVTKDKYSIHAWGRKDSIKYLNKIRKELEV